MNEQEQSWIRASRGGDEAAIFEAYSCITTHDTHNNKD